MHPQPIRFMKNGGWCWYQDPRAILTQDRLIMGGLQGHGDGSAVVGVFDLAEMKIIGQVVLHEDFGHDDHNAPAFYVRPDGSLLAMYALHSKEKRHYYRISEPGDALAWGEERVYEHVYPKADNVTYMNFFPLTAESKLYNFFRGIDFNPCFITSADQGSTWGEPTHFIADELDGRNRPYTRYAGNGVDTIHVTFTDGHPRQYGNSLYYAAFRGGCFYRANGALIKELKDEGPLLPSEADRIYEGSGERGSEYALSAVNSAWSSSMVLDAEEHPHVGYTLYLSNTDHRYRMAFWNGSQWVDREVAYAGKCLYDDESSYTGLITLDPVDPTGVVISTDVDPATGADLGGVHEIYRAHVGPDDDISTIHWEPVTRHSSQRNLRPIILRDDTRRVILWLCGRYTTFTDYDVDVVGLVESIGD